VGNWDKPFWADRGEKQDVIRNTIQAMQQQLAGMPATTLPAPSSAVRAHTVLTDNEIETIMEALLK
jgi:hypothetical protein